LLIFAFTLLIFGIETKTQASSSLLVAKLLGIMVGVFIVLWVEAIADSPIVAIARVIGIAIGIVLGIVVIIFYIWLTIMSVGQVCTRVILNFLVFCLIFVGYDLDSAYGMQAFP
jgi:hypothetical protein